MRELSLHILDIVENSLRAKAKFVEIKVIKNKDRFFIRIKDNGKGMDEEMLKKVTDPFITTKSNEKIGLGLSLLKQSALSCGGSFEIKSRAGEGTYVAANFKCNHIDCLPMGDLKTTILGLIVTHPEQDFLFCYQKGEKKFTLDTREIKRILGSIRINHPELISYLRKEIEEGIKD